MSELYEKSLKKLELDLVLSKLADCAVSAEAKDRCLALRPLNDREDIVALQEQTSAACRLITLRSSPAFQEVRDVRASLDRADRGGSLNPKELLAIAGVLRCARGAKEYYDGACANTVLDWMFAALTPNRYLEEKILGAILSEEEIAEDAEAAEEQLRENVVDYALSFVGGRYVWGGNDPHTGADCSGFVRYILSNTAGVSMSRTSADQAREGTTVSAEEMQPGDLLFYGKGSRVNHVAMYIGDGQIVHASTARTGIKVSQWNYRNPIRIASFIG